MKEKTGYAESQEIEFEYYGVDGFVEYNSNLTLYDVFDILNRSENISFMTNKTQATSIAQFNYSCNSFQNNESDYFFNTLQMDERRGKIEIRIHYSTPSPIAGGLFLKDDKEFWDNVTNQYLKDLEKYNILFYQLIDEIEVLLDLPDPAYLQISKLKW